ncbi:MAG: DUF4867 family protein [Lachnospiraceae bacterium]|nr:DUF4867 family protein [Lachnospiraceae bacterium]
MKIYNVADPEFKKYGQVLAGYDFTEIIEKMQETPLPDDVIYEPSIAELEALPIYQQLSIQGYGEMPIQIGYCNGHNTKLNAVEYHRSSEINIGATDLILLLGLESDVEEDHTYDTAKIEAFLLPKGTAVELYATTLHYAPCNADDGGFRDVIVLPKGTNYPLTGEHKAGGEDELLAATNKWLIGHAEGGLPEGSFIGLKGENITV